VSGKTESAGGERRRQGASSGEGGWGAEELQWGALTTFIAEQREGERGVRVQPGGRPVWAQGTKSDTGPWVAEVGRQEASRRATCTSRAVEGYTRRGFSTGWVRG
jgi:hypothetical protein